MMWLELLALAFAMIIAVSLVVTGCINFFFNVRKPK